MNIILVGAPGAGKGTQSAVLTKRLGIPVIATGDIIREALKKETDVGKRAKEFVNKGQLVPDEIVIEIVKNRIQEPDCEKGFILDGFPRNLPQAEALERMGVRIDCVVNIDVNDEIIYKRMSGRRVCGKCGATYNVDTDCRPTVDGVCDKCGETLVKRADDELETVKERLKVYYDQTQPLIDFYSSKGKLATVDGAQPLEKATDEIIRIVGA